MAFQQGLSGLAISTKALDVTGNNIANASTVGFKQAQAHFGDIFATSMQNAGGAQAGIGTSVSALSQQFTQGNISSSKNPLDLAISGSGFFGVSPMNADTMTYTRNGQFHLDNSGYIINDFGEVLKGTLANANGSIPGPSADGEKLQVAADVGDPKATTAITLGPILDSRSLTPTGGVYGAVTGSAVTLPVAITAGVNDSLEISDGTNTWNITLADTDKSVADVVNDINSQLVTADANARVVAVNGALKIENTNLGVTGGVMQVTGTGTANSPLGFVPAGTIGSDGKVFNPADASTYTHSTGLTVYDSLGNSHKENFYFVKTPKAGEWQMYSTFDGGQSSAPTTLNFNSLGQLITSPSKIQNTYSVNLVDGTPSTLTIDTDISSMAQSGTSFSPKKLFQDGMAIGKLSSLSVSESGVIQAVYDNGQSKNIGQVALFNFDNPNGLHSLGNNQWGQTAASGQAKTGEPNTSVFGALQSGATEDSNVDLTTELVNMIVQQRNYQASAQSIKTQDQLMQTLVNLR